MIAGPSEVLIIADRDGNPEWIAADLLAQAEHDTAAQAILITDDAALADAVGRAVEGQLKTLPRGEVAGASWRDFGAIILVGELDDAIALTDVIAPEHLEIETHDPEPLAAKIRNAGAIFLGATRPKRSAITWPVRTTCCRPRVLRNSPQDWRARLHETHLDSAL